MRKKAYVDAGVAEYANKSYFKARVSVVMPDLTWLTKQAHDVNETVDAVARDLKMQTFRIRRKRLQSSPAI